MTRVSQFDGGITNCAQIANNCFLQKQWLAMLAPLLHGFLSTHDFDEGSGLRMRHEFVVMLAVSALAGMSFSVQADNASQRTSDTPRAQAAPSPKDAASPTKGNIVMTSDSLEQRGKQLRLAIEHEYQRLKDSKTLSLPNTGKGNDVSPIILKYIPIGTSFEDAESILRGARFDLAASPPRPPRPTDPAYDRFNILGGITLEQVLFWRAEVVFVLYADIPDTAHTKVKKVFCSIITSSL